MNRLKFAGRSAQIRLFSLFATLGAAVIVPAAQAQIAQEGTAQEGAAQEGAARVGDVLSADVDGSRCTVVLRTDTDNLTTHYSALETCARVNAGDRIEYQSEITQVNIFEPVAEATVTEVSNGDRACYFTLQDEENGTTRAFADFSVCDPSYVNQQVRLTYKVTDVLAFSCNGDLECGRTEPATIISAVEVINSNPSIPDPPISPGPFQPLPPISTLPDGNYRYWDGAATDSIVPSDDLSGSAQFVFTFSKQGSNVTGIFAEVGSEAICVQGQANLNTITGISVQRFPEASVISDGETFVQFFGGSDRLQVRRGRQLPSTDSLNINGRSVPINVIRYDSAILDLERFNRINAGTRVPPRRC